MDKAKQLIFKSAISDALEMAHYRNLCWKEVANHPQIDAHEVLSEMYESSTDEAEFIAAQGRKHIDLCYANLQALKHAPLMFDFLKRLRDCKDENEAHDLIVNSMDTLDAILDGE